MIRRFQRRIRDEYSICRYSSFSAYTLDYAARAALEALFQSDAPLSPGRGANKAFSSAFRRSSITTLATGVALNGSRRRIALPVDSARTDIVSPFRCADAYSSLMRRPRSFSHVAKPPRRRFHFGDRYASPAFMPISRQIFLKSRALDVSLPPRTPAACRSRRARARYAEWAMRLEREE